MSQQFDLRTSTPSPSGVVPDTGDRWRALLLTVVGLLLAGAVLTPWARATAPSPPHPEPGFPLPLTDTPGGLTAGTGLWGWVTLLCAVAITALALTGAARRAHGPLAATVAPSVGAVVALLVAVPGLLHQKLPDQVKLTVLGRGASLAMRLNVFTVLDQQTDTTLGWGWIAALALALLALCVGLSGLMTRRQNSPSDRPAGRAPRERTAVTRRRRSP